MEAAPSPPSKTVRKTLDDVLSFSLVALNLDLYEWQQVPQR